jgi:uncharacterized protein
MIVYKKRKVEFLADVDSGEIGEIVSRVVTLRLGVRVGPSEKASWSNSLEYMGQVLSPDDVCGDSFVAIEYRIPRTSNRIDFLVAGQGPDGASNLVIIELKQWSKVEKTMEDAIVRTALGGGLRSVVHPSYQAWSYASLLSGFNEAVHSGKITLFPCAYLHNYQRDGVIDHVFYEDHLTNAPLFCQTDRKELRSFIADKVTSGDQDDVITKLDAAPIRPSKVLAEQVSKMLRGNDQFVMIDTQKVVYERAMSFALSATDEKKKVLLVQGGPGTGKSVIAVNLLAKLTKAGKFAQYVTKNSAPRSVYESLLADTFKKTEISNLFKGSGSYVETPHNACDALIVDEAHRLNEKSGIFSNKGENQIKEIIHSSKVSVFFIDDAQRIHIKDIGSSDEIRKWAGKFGADLEEVELTSQFRCAGSDGYLAWVDNVLGIRETANYDLSEINYDFRVFDSPSDLRDEIFDKNRSNNKSRLVAGYCWDWVSKKDSDLKDISIPGFDFSMQWNLGDDGMLWMIKENSVHQIGCIHTCQGLELDYVGVIIGPDMLLEEGEVITDPTARSNQDRSIFGWKKQMKTNPEETKAKLDSIIRNTYRTLTTRGMKGCYVYAVDKELNEYLKAAINGA